MAENSAGHPPAGGFASDDPLSVANMSDEDYERLYLSQFIPAEWLREFRERYDGTPAADAPSNRKNESSANTKSDIGKSSDVDAQPSDQEDSNVDVDHNMVLDSQEFQNLLLPFGAYLERRLRPSQRVSKEAAVKMDHEFSLMLRTVIGAAKELLKYHDEDPLSIEILGETCSYIENLVTLREERSDAVWKSRLEVADIRWAREVERLEGIHGKGKINFDKLRDNPLSGFHDEGAPLVLLPEGLRHPRYIVTAIPPGEISMLEKQFQEEESMATALGIPYQRPFNFRQAGLQKVVVNGEARQHIMMRMPSAHVPNQDFEVPGGPHSNFDHLNRLLARLEGQVPRQGPMPVDIPVMLVVRRNPDYVPTDE
ncbi:hypothetical protein NA57DRAFT_51844 [Rhizodiscina lignyota]|uniref:Uncharacterized protein n=1 Tax=Rhizodiscina lignyota TaxID=1504668 RepID=A0A9P4ISJ1_9PEZI|nr:hypothetical protein NA57DRAFT_51844 [Rhizodiscina lignyota]